MLDPNLVYMLLLFSLWSVVTAAYLPGTGIIEIFSGALALGAIYLLAQLPTNWGAVILIVVGVLGFLVMPFINQRWAVLAVGGLVLQGAGSLFLFNGLPVSLPLITVVIGLSLIYHRYALLPILRKHREQTDISEDDQLIGAHGRVVQPIDRRGSVYVQGETWTARSSQPLDRDDEVVVLAREGLVLVVEGVKHKREELAQGENLS
jgi:membrane-bound serine protease (ClpP class)